MIVRAIWEFDVDDSWGETHEECVELTKRELDVVLDKKDLCADDFQYEVHPELPSDYNKGEC